MDSRVLAASIAFFVVSAITPGPNNLMLASSGLTFGFRRTLPLLCGIQIGFQALLIAVAAGAGLLFERYPHLQWLLKAAGAAYLLYLAYKLWRSSSGGAASMSRPIGFYKAAAFQVINPKAWMMTVSAVGAYTLPGGAYWPSVGNLVALFLVICMPLMSVWAVFGSTFRAAISDPATSRRVGRTLAVATGLSCVLVFL
ncbi:LysE family translocator [Lysobacter sp. HA18]